MLMLPGGSTNVMAAAFMTQKLKEVQKIFLMAMCNVMVEISDPSPLTKLEDILDPDMHTVNLAPMLAILFDWTRMRALQIDPKHGRHQRRAQEYFYDYTVFVYVQTLAVIFMLFCTEYDCKEGDVIFVMENQTLEAVVTANWYRALLGPYSGFTAVNYAVSPMTDVYKLNAQTKAPKDWNGDMTDAKLDFAQLHAMDVAQKLRDHPAKMQDMPIDAVDDTKVAEIKRAVFRALTQLRAATIKEFDAIAQVEPVDRRLRQG